MKQKIIPHLWMDDQAEEAASFYASLFPDSGIRTVTRFQEAGSEIHGKPPGSVQAVEFDLSGYQMVIINGGPMFEITPAISLFVTCESREEIDQLWERLLDGGQAMMPISDDYAWSQRYGWLQDRFGLTWQLSQGRIEDVGQKIAPSFLFVGEQFGRAEEALNLYTSVFENTHVDGILRYEAGEPGPEGTVKHAQFVLDGQVLMVMDGPGEHPFTFTEGVSLLVPCRSQEEVDRFWDALSQGGDPEAQQCGWLKDRFGVSWQIVPERMLEMLKDSDIERVERVTASYLQMKKLDLAELARVYQEAEKRPRAEA